MITAVAAGPSIDVTYVVDAMRLGEINRPTVTVRVPGGKGLNAARAMHRLGADVHAVAPLGGRAGDWVAARLVALGIAVHVTPADAETRTCVSIADDGSHTMTEVYERAGELSGDEWQAFLGAVDDCLAQCGSPGWVTVSGSVPPPSTGRVGDLVRVARARGVRVAVDVHSGSLAQALSIGVDVVKVNAHEAASVLGAAAADSSVESLAAALARQVSVGAVVTAGVEGVWAVRQDGARRSLHATQNAHRGPFPVGSGDCLLGGLVVGLDRGEDLLDAVGLATAAATANALCPGAGDFRLTDVQRVLADLSP